jgi:hypothetical protein
MSHQASAKGQKEAQAGPSGSDNRQTSILRSAKSPISETGGPAVPEDGAPQTTSHVESTATPRASVEAQTEDAAIVRDDEDTSAPRQETPAPTFPQFRTLDNFEREMLYGSYGIRERHEGHVLQLLVRRVAEHGFGAPNLIRVNRMRCRSSEWAAAIVGACEWIKAECQEYTNPVSHIVSILWLLADMVLSIEVDALENLDPNIQKIMLTHVLDLAHMMHSLLMRDTMPIHRACRGIQGDEGLGSGSWQDPPESLMNRHHVEHPV